MIKPRPLLSILTPAIPERMGKLGELCRTLDAQIVANALKASVEHLVFVDTRGARTVGEKRDELVRMARGEYVAFCDDDDLISDNYITHLTSAILSVKGSPDVITFRQRVTYCGETGEVEFGLGNINEPFTPGAITKRSPWHVCAFKASIAKAHHFPPSNYGEDWAWARHACADCTSSVHIPTVLHHYIHDPATTAAPAPL